MPSLVSIHGNVPKRGEQGKGVNCMMVHGIPFNTTINSINRCCGAVRRFAGVSLCLLLPQLVNVHCYL